MLNTFVLEIYPEWSFAYPKRECFGHLPFRFAPVGFCPLGHMIVGSVRSLAS